MGYPILLVREKRGEGRERRGREGKQGKGRDRKGEEEGLRRRGGEGRERRDMGQAMVMPITPNGSLVYYTGCLPLHRVSTAAWGVYCML